MLSFFGARRHGGAALKMNEVVRVGCASPPYCPCVVVVPATPVVFRNRHVAIGVHCLDVSSVVSPNCNITDPRSFAVRHTSSSSRIDPVASTSPSDTLVVIIERYSPLVELVSGVAHTFACPKLPFVQDLQASIRGRAYTSVIVGIG